MDSNNLILWSVGYTPYGQTCNRLRMSRQLGKPQLLEWIKTHVVDLVIQSGLALPYLLPSCIQYWLRSSLRLTLC